MLILKPLTPAIFGELRGSRDVLQTLPQDFLVIAPKPCENVVKCTDCLCQRAFIGTQSGCATTLAVVCEEKDVTCYGHFIDSPLAEFWWGSNGEHMAADHLWRVSAGLEPFNVGEVLRVRWSRHGAKFYRAEFCTESEVMASSRQAMEN